MENNLDFKQELQRDLRDLQQDIAQHSTFNNDLWRRSIKRSAQRLYRVNLLSSIILTITALVYTPFMLLGHKWPWWFVLLFDLFMGYLIVRSLIALRGMRRPDVHTQAGLLSLRDSVRQASKPFPLRERIPYMALGAVLMILFFMLLYKTEPDIFKPVLFATLLSLPTGYLASIRTNKKIKNLSKEIDELLKEE